VEAGDTALATGPIVNRALSDADILVRFRIDTSVWYIKKLKVNAWEIGAKLPSGQIATEPLYQTTAWLERVEGVAIYQEIAARLRADMLAWRPPTYKAVRRTPVLDSHMLEVCIADLHLGLYAWGQEAGADYDLAIAERIFIHAMDDLLAKVAPFPIERVVLALGGDILHVDQSIGGAGGATTAGTPQDVDDRWQKAFRVAVAMLVRAVEKLREIAPVEIIVVPGNHDLDRLFGVGEVLTAWFRQDPEVVVTNTPSPRTYLQHGCVLLGYTHKKVKDLALTMANEAPEAWAATAGGHREWHTAHLHAADLEEVGGVRIRTVPALAANSAWATEHGFRHLRCAEAFLWHREKAFIGLFSVMARSDS
jgi:hypothetical protein